MVYALKQVVKIIEKNTRAKESATYEPEQEL